MADGHADFNAELRRRARAGTVTLDLGDREDTRKGRAEGAHERLEAARADGDPVRIEEAEHAMDEAVHEWRAARRARAEGEGSVDGRTPAAAPDFGAGARRSIARPPSMTDRLRADKLGVPVANCRPTCAPRVERNPMPPRLTV